MPLPFPSPTDPHSSTASVLVGYLDYFRETTIAKESGLSDDETRRSRLPSGWTPLSLLRHLTWVELRWVDWGFDGRSVADPWADQHGERWSRAGRRVAAPTTLHRVLLHLLQEHASHLGHLDVVRELVDGAVGE